MGDITCLCSTWRLLVITLILSLICGVYEVIADCTCFPKHPQQHFCEADFVIRATAKPLDIVLPNGENVTDSNLMDLAPEVVNSATKLWKMRISHVFKGKSFLFPGISVQVHTPLYDGRCGVNHMKPDKPYVIMGRLETDGRLTFDYCNWHKKWTEISARQKKGLRSTYKDNCRCHVHTCGIGSECGDRESQFDRVCDWNPFQGACFNKHALCQLQLDKTCAWSYPSDHKDCETTSR